MAPKYGKRGSRNKKKRASRPSRVYIHVHLYENTNRWGAWVREPKVRGKRLFVGTHLTERLAARCQDRALLRIEHEPGMTKQIKLNFDRADYAEDEDLRSNMSVADFFHMLRGESRAHYKKFYQSECLKKFLAEEDALGNLPSSSNALDSLDAEDNADEEVTDEEDGEEILDEDDAEEDSEEEYSEEIPEEDDEIGNNKPDTNEDEVEETQDVQVSNNEDEVEENQDVELPTYEDKVEETQDVEVPTCEDKVEETQDVEIPPHATPTTISPQPVAPLVAPPVVPTPSEAFDSITTWVGRRRRSGMATDTEEEVMSFMNEELKGAIGLTQLKLDGLALSPAPIQIPTPTRAPSPTPPRAPTPTPPRAPAPTLTPTRQRRP